MASDDGWIVNASGSRWKPLAIEDNRGSFQNNKPYENNESINKVEDGTDDKTENKIEDDKAYEEIKNDPKDDKSQEKSQINNEEKERKEHRKALNKSIIVEKLGIKPRPESLHPLACIKCCTEDAICHMEPCKDIGFCYECLIDYDKTDVYNVCPNCYEENIIHKIWDDMPIPSKYAYTLKQDKENIEKEENDE